VNPYRITFIGSPESAMSSPRSATLTSSQHSGPTRAVEPWCMSSTVINQRPRRSCSTSPAGTPLARRRSGLFFVQGDRKAGPSDSRGAPLKVAGKGAKRSTKGNKRGQSGDPNESQSLLAAMRATTTRRLSESPITFD
jgi:hypothetical protein